MPTATRKVTIVFSGGVDGEQEISAGINASSPAAVELKTLSSGANTITVPTSGKVPTAVTIVPPGSNAIAITLKGVSGDTGIRLHDTDPTTIALHSSVATFVLNAAADVTGVRFFWS